MSAAEPAAACDFCDRTPDEAGVQLAGRTVCICQHCVGQATAFLLRSHDLEKPGALAQARAAGHDTAIGEVANLMDAIEGRRARPRSLWRAVRGALRSRQGSSP